MSVILLMKHLFLVTLSKSKRKKVTDEEKKQIDFTSEMDGIKMRGNKSRKQNTKTKNITNLCDSWDKVNHFFKDYTTIIVLLQYDKNMEKTQNFNS